MKTEEPIEQLREQREGMTNTMLDMLSCISSERENVKKLAEACRQFMSCASTSPQMDCKTVVYRWNPAKLGKAYEAALVALRPNTHKNNRNTKGTKQMNITVTKQKLLEAVAAHKAGRSAWSRGVKAYAVELVEGIDDGADLANEVMLQKELFNGADNWRQYSEGGAALCYDADIAERLCSPSELKRTKWGMLPPNGRENWLEVQARALWQAHKVVEKAWRKLEGGAL